MPKHSYSKFWSKWGALCRIEQQIRHGRATTARALAEELEVDTRTIRRYIALMREGMGAPVRYDPIEQRYELTDLAWTMPNVHLSEQEMVALAVAARTLGAVTPAPFSTHLEELFAKLANALPEDHRHELESLGQKVEVLPTPVASKGQQWVEPLVEAIREPRTVEMDYYTMSTGEEARRRVDPYHLRFFAGTWYLVGFDPTAKEMKVFNLARIRMLQITEDGFRPRPFNPREYFRHSFGIMVGGEPQMVRIRLTGWAAETAGERVWPAGFTYTLQPDGSGLLVGKVGMLDDLKAWIAGFSGAATLLEGGKA